MLKFHCLGRGCGLGVGPGVGAEAGVETGVGPSACRRRADWHMPVDMEASTGALVIAREYGAKPQDAARVVMWAGTVEVWGVHII